MIVLHAAPISWGKIGGLQVSIPSLVAAQNRLGNVHAAMLITLRNTAPPPDLEFPVFDQKLSVDRLGRLNLPAPFDRPDLVVLHSTYIPAHARIAALMRKSGTPYVVCPRGGMTQRAQTSKRWKKRAGNLLFFNWIISNATALHYLTEGEANASELRRLPRFVVGNGVDVPETSALASPGQSDGLRLVFLGRLHADHKGLDLLLDACAHVAGELRRAHARLDLYGSDWCGSAAALARQIRRLGLKDIVEVHGPVVGHAKAELLKRADVFVHTSRTEGHPIAVLEALACGVPCLLTPQTNLADEVAGAGAGWRVEPSAAAIADGLQEIGSIGSEALQLAGANARRLAAKQFNWQYVAEQCVHHYRKIAA